MNSKNLKLLVAAGMLLTLASCGNDKNSSARRGEKNPICAEIDCMSSVNWKIQVVGRSFPDQSRVDINGTTVLNECVAKQKYMINRAAEPQELYLDNFYVPKRGELKIDILDCTSEASVIKNDNVDFEVTKGAQGIQEILISL